MRRRLARLLAVTLVGVAASVVLPSAPATATACVEGTGVTAVVDFQQLGGSTQVVCVPSGGGKYADAIFGSAGISMEYATREPGFVCKVETMPESAPCVNASPGSAYWSLWWSDGSGGWTYASSGVGGLKVKAGGFVAWSWQGQSAKRAPRIAPVGAAAPKPSVEPTAAPTTASPKSPKKRSSTRAPATTPAPRPTAASGGGGRTSRAPGATPSPSVAPTVSPSPTTSSRVTPSPAAGSSAAPVSPDPESTDDVSSTASEPTGSSSLGWVAAAIVIVLLGSSAVVASRRRARRL